MNFFSKLFLIEIDFWSAGVIQGFALNFSLYLLTDQFGVSQPNLYQNSQL